MNEKNEEPGVRDRITNWIVKWRRTTRGDGEVTRGTSGPHLAARVRALEEAVQENRQLSQRLADVVDVVTEVLVPAADRDDERLRLALANLNKTLDQG